MELYCPRSDRWTAVASLPRRRLQFAVAVSDGRRTGGGGGGGGGGVYVVGGRDGLRTLDVVQQFDVGSRAWASVTAMNTHRHGLGRDAELHCTGTLASRAVIRSVVGRGRGVYAI